MSDMASNLYGDGASRSEPTSTPPDSGIGSIADRLYGGSQEPAETTTKEPAQSDDESRASRLYEAKEEQRGNPYALEKDTTDTLYGGTNNVRLPDYLNTDGLLDQGGDAETLRTNLGYIAAEAGASEADVTGMVSIAQEYVRNGQKVESEEQRGQILSEVMSQNGYTDSHLADARDLVASYPDLADWLGRTGAGDDPKMVSRMVKASQSPRAQRRIQQFRNRR